MWWSILLLLCARLMSNQVSKHRQALMAHEFWPLHHVGQLMLNSEKDQNSVSIIYQEENCTHTVLGNDYHTEIGRKDTVKDRVLYKTNKLKEHINATHAFYSKPNEVPPWYTGNISKNNNPYQFNFQEKYNFSIGTWPFNTRLCKILRNDSKMTLTQLVLPIKSRSSTKSSLMRDKRLRHKGKTLNWFIKPFHLKEKKGEHRRSNVKENQNLHAPDRIMNTNANSKRAAERRPNTLITLLGNMTMELGNYLPRDDIVNLSRIMTETSLNTFTSYRSTENVTLVSMVPVDNQTMKNSDFKHKEMALDTLNVRNTLVTSGLKKEYKVTLVSLSEKYLIENSSIPLDTLMLSQTGDMALNTRVISNSELETPQRLTIKQYSPSVRGLILENMTLSYKLLRTQTALGLMSGTPVYARERRHIQEDNTRLTESSSCNHGNKPRKRRQVDHPCRCPECYSDGNVQGSDDEYVNVAFNKPGRYNIGHKEYPHPCAAVNGDRSHVDKTSPPYNCIHTGASTSEPLKHWLEYDLLDVYTIDRITLYRRYISNKNFIDIFRLKAMDISVDGEICFSTPGYNDVNMDSFLTEKVLTLTCQTPITGRYVRFGKRQEVHPAKPEYHYIVFCELIIWVCDNSYYWEPSKGCIKCPSFKYCKYLRCDNYYGCNKTVYWNPAIRRPAIQSSVHKGGPQNAVDGRLLADSADDCTSTIRAEGDKRNSWWQVNLGSFFAISFVKVTNRQECCGWKLKNFHVMVSREQKSYSRSFPTKDVCHKFSGPFDTGETKRLPCSQLLVGQYVSLVTHFPYLLQLCEVQPYGYAVEELRPGEICGFLNTVRYCREGTTCIDNICKTEPGGSCLGNDRYHCRSGAACYNGICVLAVNAPCANTALRCESGAVCDANSQFTCKYNLGSVCQGYGSCIHGTVCDPLNRCKIKVQFECRSNQDLCQYFALCDVSSGYLCKWNLGVSCNGTNECKKGLVCDHFNRCKIPVGYSCFKSSECIGGAICQGSKCYCPGNDTSACDPQEGRAGGPCSTLTVCVEHSTCTNGSCRCDTGYEVSEELFSCKLSMGSSCQTSQQCNTGLVCDGQICRMEYGSICVETTLCKKDSHCHSGICKIKPGYDCRAFPHLCVLGSVCDNGFCKIQFEHTCDQDNDHCRDGTMCSRTKEDNTPICRLSPGRSCLGHNKTLCAGIALCDKGNVCKVKPAESCAQPYQNDCIYGTKCQNGKCRLYAGHACNKDDECEMGAVCDQLYSQCRLKVDRPCAAPPPRDMCSSGAICNSDNRCACVGSGATVRKEGRCEPASKKIGGTCDASEAQTNLACDDANARCAYNYNSTVPVCQCIAGYEVERTNYTCGAGIGTMCKSSDITVTCSSGLICDFNGFCSLEIGQQCKDENRRWCKTGAVCEQDICKANFNQDCSGSNRDKCKSDTSCDILFRCKFARNSSCSTADVCVAGSLCENDTCQCDPTITRPAEDICEAVDGVVTGSCKSSSCNDPNARCTQQQTCQCQEGYTVQSSDLSCKISAGYPCSVTESFCTAGTTCEDTKERCSLNLGQYCGDGNEDQCVTGAVCDFNKECKLDLNGRCNDPDTFHCKRGTFCDWHGRCKIGVALLCNYSSDCVAGATCVDSVCQCMAIESVQGGLICEPKSGYIGGSCDDFNKCIPAGSVCTNEICHCGNGFKTSEESFHCVPSTGQLKNSVTGDLPLLILPGVLAGAIIAALSVLAVRKRKKKEKALQEMTIMKEEREELSDKVEEALHVASSDQSSSFQTSTVTASNTSPSEAFNTSPSEAFNTSPSGTFSTASNETTSSAMTSNIVSGIHKKSDASETVL